MKNDKIVLKNHGWEKQQTPKTKKKSGRQRNPPKQIFSWVKRIILNAYSWTHGYLEIKDVQLHFNFSTKRVILNIYQNQNFCKFLMKTIFVSNQTQTNSTNH